MSAEDTGPLGTCVACGKPGRMEAHFANGWVDKRCLLSASTIIEIRWINGVKFTRCLKGLAPKERKVESA